MRVGNSLIPLTKWTLKSADLFSNDLFNSIQLICVLVVPIIKSNMHFDYIFFLFQHLCICSVFHVCIFFLNGMMKRSATVILELSHFCLFSSISQRHLLQLQKLFQQQNNSNQITGCESQQISALPHSFLLSKTSL